MLIPITAPWESSNGPPELPGLIAASVCTMPSNSRLPSSRIVRFRLLIIPVVNVPSNPNGLPMARTFCPTCNPSDSPSRRNGSFFRGVIRSKPKSFPGSFASTSASYLD